MVFLHLPSEGVILRWFQGFCTYLLRCRRTLAPEEFHPSVDLFPILPQCHWKLPASAGATPLRLSIQVVFQILMDWTELLSVRTHGIVESGGHSWYDEMIDGSSLGVLLLEDTRK